MASANIKIEGMKELVQKLERIERLDAIKPAIKAAAAHVKSVVNVYPPASEGNQPKAAWTPGGPNSWYQRGRGPFWIVKSGQVHSKKSSETLGRRWTTSTKNNGLTGVVGNNVSYGPYVQDEEKQASFHAARGWKTIQTAAEEEAKTVTEFIRRAVERELDRK